jgi:tRNA pseudouridine55 synthase
MNDPSAGVGRPVAGELDGVVLLDKPLGLTSNAALQRVKRLLGVRKAGHTGSLDPLATGLLPICLGQATRFSGYLLEAAKGYRVSGRLGTRTSTGDAEGEVVETCEWRQVDQDGLAAVLETFLGRIEQVPPMYSALKQGGERLYRKARRGEQVERAPREIEIYALSLANWAPPDFSLEVRCSKGTYVRTLVEDAARSAGSCAHVTALRRFAAGPFCESGMHTFEALERLSEEDRLAEAILPCDTALAALPVMALTADHATRIRQGQAVELAAGAGEELVRLYAGEEFLGVGERGADGRLRAKRLMASGTG